MWRHSACRITLVVTLGGEEGGIMEDLEETEEVEDIEMMVIGLIISEAIIEEDSEVRENSYMSNKSIDNLICSF
jgi:hypothetical protein